jgi:asparagine synthase (glutamine-hydrolysing)
MSGIVGILNTDGAPVSRDLIGRMVEALRFRGPDAQNLWTDGQIGFGHTLLDTTGAATIDQQPCSIDDRVWIVCDSRIDARSELRDKLRASSNAPQTDFSAARLILLAYQRWGQECLDHLIGDFAFAIWDAPKKQLFCARDHFGVKPFYFASLPNSFIFSNTLNCLRLHPDVSADLNDRTISDYLLFGYGQDASTTSFEQIQKLPPGHFLLCSEGKLKISRYWRLQQTSELHYKKRQEYVENFRSVLAMAVGDRLPSGRAAVFMSGGLDSSTIAATARRASHTPNQAPLDAYMVGYDRLIQDQERRYAGMVAKFCGIPLHYLVADDYQLFQHWQEDDASSAEPCDQPLSAIDRDLYSRIAADVRVVLTGEGGDPCLVPSPEAVIELLRAGKFLELAAGYGRCAWWQRSVPKVGLRTLIRKRTGDSEAARLPEWINPELALKFDLGHRARELEDGQDTVFHDRAAAFKNLTQLWWTNYFELYDPGNLRQLVETRHPFFDIRVVSLLLSLPTLPWCLGKQIIREAMAGILPPEIIRRRKTPLAGNPLAELLRQPQAAWIDSFEPTPELLYYVDRSRVPRITGRTNVSPDPWLHLRPLTLNHWLRTQPILGYKGPT